MQKQVVISTAISCCVACVGYSDPAEVTSAEEALVTHKPAIVAVADPNGKPISCATIRSLDGAYIYVTDSSGIAAIYEPELMGKTMSFAFTHPGDLGVFQTPGTDKDGKPIVIPFLRNLNLKEAAALGDLNVVTSIATVPPGTTCPTPVPAYTTFLDSNGNVPQGAALAKVIAVDSQTNRPVPAVSFASPRRTYVTDSNGVVGIYENGFMSTSVSFNVSSDGYVAKSNVALTLTAGQTQTVRIDPQPDQIAQRLYRLTGANKMRDSVLLGDVAQQALNADVLSQDGPMTAVYNGKVYWTFGDTTHPVGGNFRGSSATTDFAADPAKPLTLTYVHQVNGSDTGIAPETVFTPGDKAAWPGGLVSITDAQGQHLFSNFLLIDAAYNHFGFDLGSYGGDAAGTYDFQTAIDESKPSQPGAHAYAFNAVQGAYVFFENSTRYPATVAGVTTPSTYQTYTALNQNGIARDPSTQRILYTWQVQQPEITDAVGRFIQLPPEEILDGKIRSIPADASAPHSVPVKSHARSYDAYRQRFVDVITENKLPMDATWYAEADTPVGPWVYAKRIVGNGEFSQYNPVITPYMKNGGAQIFFAQVFGNAGLGTATAPYYNYNILMYLLDLTDGRMALPVPVYELAASTAPSHTLGTKAQVRSTMPAELPVPFFAYDRSATGTVPAYLTGASCRATHTLKVGTQGAFPVLFAPDFYVIPANATNPPADSVALYEFTRSTDHAYATEGVATPSGFTKNTTPVARVFTNPISKVWIPVRDYLGDLVADAGADICGSETSRGGGANVVLDASKTVLPAGKTANYTWMWTTSSTVTGTATGQRPTVHLPAGTHVVQLVVQTSDNRTSYDKVIVDIAAI